MHPIIRSTASRCLQSLILHLHHLRICALWHIGKSSHMHASLLLTRMACMWVLR